MKRVLIIAVIMEALSVGITLAQMVFSQPVHIEGKVVDQFNVPVSGADVWAETIRDMSEKTVLIKTVSAQDGSFTLNGFGGVGTVTAHMKGYHNTDASNQVFVSNPVQLTLRKIVQGQPLILSAVQIILDAGGGIDKLGGIKECHIFKKPNITWGDPVLAFQCCLGGRAPGPKEMFPWKVKISIPGGGLQLSPDPNVTEAPQNGYSDSLLIDSSTLTKWRDKDDIRMFAVFSNHTFAKIRIKLTLQLPGRDSFVNATTVYNPYGTRNTDFDPDNELKT